MQPEPKRISSFGTADLLDLRPRPALGQGRDDLKEQNIETRPSFIKHFQ